MSEEYQEQPEAKKPRRVELTERDLHILKWIGEQYAVGLDQIAELLGQQAGAGAQTPGKLSGSATRVWVARMKAIGAIEQEKPFRTLPPFVWLTTEGLHLAELDYKPLRPATSTLNHLYWCNEARLYIALRRPQDTWRSERFLRSEHAQAGKSGNHHTPDVPDGLVISEEGRKIAVEVELTDKQQARLNGLMMRRSATYSTVWYFCTNETYSIVGKARQQLKPAAQEYILIYTLDKLKEGRTI